MSLHVGAGRAGRMSRSTRRRQLLAAAQAAFVRNGYHAAGMDDIATRAGVSKPVLYQHFPGKMELYLAVLDEQVGVLERTVRDALDSTHDNEQRVASVLSAYFDFVDGSSAGGDAGAYRLLFESDLASDPAVRTRMDRTTDVTVQAVSATVRADTGLPDDQAHLLGVALIGAAQVAARWWLDSGRPIPKGEAVRLLGILQWRGISNFPRQ